VTSTASKPIPLGRSGRIVIDVGGERIAVEVCAEDTDASIAIKLMAAIDAHVVSEWENAQK